MFAPMQSSLNSAVKFCDDGVAAAVAWKALLGSVYNLEGFNAEGAMAHKVLMPIIAQMQRVEPTAVRFEICLDAQAPVVDDVDAFVKHIAAAVTTEARARLQGPQLRVCF